MFAQLISVGKKYYKIIFLESFIQTEGRFYTDRMRIIYLLKTLQKIIYEILTC